MNDSLVLDGVVAAGDGTRPVGDVSALATALRDAGGAFGWVDLVRPDPATADGVAEALGIDPAVLTDRRVEGTRSRLERRDGLAVLAFRTLGPGLDVRLSEARVVAGPRFVVTVQDAPSLDLDAVRDRVLADPAARGDTGMAAVVDAAVRGFAAATVALRTEIDAVEDDLFDGDADPGSSRRIYQLLTETITIRRALAPLDDVLRAIGEGPDVPQPLRAVLTATEQEVTHVAERAGAFRVLLENALTLHATLVTQEQSEEMRRMTAASLAMSEDSRRLAEVAIAQGEQVKRISSWAAILYAPSLIAGIYGMNFRVLPELRWQWGYPFALGLMVLFSGTLWVIFRRLKWL